MDEEYRVRNVGALCFECAFETSFEEQMFDGCEFSLGFSGGMGQDLANWSGIITTKRSGC